MNPCDGNAVRHSSAGNGAGISDIVCDSLCRVLREGVDVHRCLAAQALGRMAHPAAVEALTRALLDEDEDVRSDAARALRGFADPRSARQLLENLVGDPCSDVKLNAIEALAHMRRAELVPWLRRLLRGRDDEIVWDEEEFYADGWDGWIDVQAKAIEALAALGAEDAVGDIVAAIDDEFGQDISETGFKALARLGEPGIAALARYVDDASERRRRRAAIVVAGLDAETAGDAVDRALRDPSANVRLAAARALAARRPSDRRLVALLRDPIPEVRAEIVGLCGGHHPESLETLLDDDSPAVRRAALTVIAGAPELLSAEAVAGRARAWLADADAGLAAAAAGALAAVEPALAVDDLAAQLANPARPIEVRLAALKGLAASHAREAVRALAAAVGDDKRQVRLDAIAALAALASADGEWPNSPGAALLAALRGELVPEPAGEEAPQSEPGADTGDEGAAPPDVDETSSFPTSTLQAILGDDCPPSPVANGDETSVELTQEDLDFLALSRRTPRKARVPATPRIAPSRDVRQFAARVLGGLPRDEVARELAVRLKEDDDEEVRRAAADSLARIGDRLGAFPTEVVDGLLAGLGDADRDIRLSILRALGTAGDAGAAKAVSDRLGDDDSFIRIEAIRAHARLGGAVSGIEALLADPEPGVREAAARAIAEYGGDTAVDLLVDFAFAFGGCHRRAAGRLLRKVDPAAANARLLAVLADRDRKAAWQAAIEALDELNRSDVTANKELIA